MKILFIYPNNARSVYILSLAERLKQKNIDVVFLFLCPTGDLQIELEQYGIVCYNYESGQKGLISQLLKNTLFVLKFARKHKPNCIFSHLHIPNFCAALAGYFLPKIKVITCRHHADEFYQSLNNKGVLLDKSINQLSKNIVVISQKAYEHLVDIEKVPKKKLTFLPLAYDFEKYIQKDSNKENFIISTCDLSVVFISRLVSGKRIDSFFPVIQYFKSKGIRIHARIIGEGPLEKDLKQQVEVYNISDCISFLGFQKQQDIIPLIQSAHLLVHLSASESSNQVVKEAGYCGKTVVACKGAGDFDDYLNDSNAYFIENNFTTDDLVAVTEQILRHPEELQQKGEKLRTVVIDRFTLTDKILNQYLDVLT